MLAGQILRCALHGGKIRLVVQHGHVFAVKDRLGVAHVAGVGIELADSAVARVKAVSGELRLLHADVVGEIAVHVVADLVRRFLRVHIGVGRHGLRVDTGVGAAGADDLHVRPAHAGQDGFELALDRVAARLPLPAEIAGAVIADDEFEIFHASSSMFFVYRQAG